MNILLCLDKFKFSLTANEACAALSKGILSKGDSLNVISHPMADGGEGSLELVKEILNLKSISVHTLDPLGRKIKAAYTTSDDTAFIELACASGLSLLKKQERNPMLSSTLGTGLMIKDAIENGYKKIFLFVGGSATNDGGIGIAKALGFDFLSEDKSSLDPIGMNLAKIHTVINTKTSDISSLDLTVLHDVSNPMHGPDGAAFTYAQQKGASQEDIISLDEGLKNYASILNRNLNYDIGSISGIGAAGAVSASLLALLNAEMKDGFEVLAEITNLEEKIKNSSLVITGEGKVDASSFQGKLVGKVISLCKKYKVPCGIVAGNIQELKINNETIAFSKSLQSRAIDVNDSIESAEKYLVEIGLEISEEFLV